MDTHEGLAKSMNWTPPGFAQIWVHTSLANCLDMIYKQSLANTWLNRFLQFALYNLMVTLSYEFVIAVIPLTSSSGNGFDECFLYNAKDMCMHKRPCKTNSVGKPYCEYVISNALSYQMIFL